MDNKKFEKLIDLIINEDEEQARAMFHDIVVEKSREIYENLMADEMDEGMGGPVGGLLDEISAEEEGMTEEEDEFADIEVDDGMGDEEGTEMSHDDMDDMGGEEELEDRVVDLEDKLDELMAEFEQLMGGEGEEEHDEEGSDEEQGDEDMMESSDDEEEESLEEAEEDDEEEDTLEEAIQLKKVSVTHGDNGQNTKSVVSSGPKVPGNGASASNLNKGGTATGGTVKAPATIPGKYKNAPGQDGSKTEAAPKAKAGDNGSNTKSVIESKKSVKKIVK